mmetsp:Transcript_123820/g.321624  ORF Transcript_123820/g.321624 Transcript_123820/m.321624 type:complete len:234 (-) Transcript_123820:44-745(-)
MHEQRAPRPLQLLSEARAQHLQKATASELPNGREEDDDTPENDACDMMVQDGQDCRHNPHRHKNEGQHCTQPHGQNPLLFVLRSLSDAAPARLFLQEPHWHCLALLQTLPHEAWHLSLPHLNPASHAITHGIENIAHQVELSRHSIGLLLLLLRELYGLRGKLLCKHFGLDLLPLRTQQLTGILGCVDDGGQDGEPKACEPSAHKTEQQAISQAVHVKVIAPEDLVTAHFYDG